jgi:hypothetical protein
MLTMAPLLLHSPDVPATVRDALRAAFAADPDERDEHLHTAAHLLLEETGLPCADIKELIGLTSCTAC